MRLTIAYRVTRSQGTPHAAKKDERVNGFRAPRCAIVAFTAATMLSACGRQAALNPAPSQEQSAVLNSNRRSGDLIYAGGHHYVEVYTFPSAAYRATFTVKGFVNGMCSDSKGNVFVAAAAQGPPKTGAGYVFEYAHGGTVPIETLNLPNREVPFACSSDPITSNLAVTAQNNHNFAPIIAIYAKAHGAPTVYTSRAIGADPQAAYDDDGDLFATSGGNIGVELLHGKSALSKVTMAATLGGVAHIQWDGEHWALQSFLPTSHSRERLFERIYRVRISGSNATIVGTSRVEGWPEKHPGQSWIRSATILGTPLNEIDFWAYPSGGEPKKRIQPAHPAKAITVSIGS